MRSLLLLTKKNIKLLLRAKSSALIVFLAPLLIILVLGLSYNSSAQYGLNIGIYAPSFTDDVNSFSASLQERDFKVIKYEDLDECVQDIKIGSVHTCISLPEQFEVQDNAAKEVTFYIDPSRINLVWMIQETLKSEFNLRAQEISQELAQEVLSKLQQAKTTADEKSSQAATIREKSASASSSAEATKSSLEGLDVTAPSNEYDSAIVAGVSANLSSHLNSGASDIDDALASVESSNISASTKDAIKTSLNDAKTQLTNAQELVTGSGEGSIGKITELVNALQSEVSSSREKLSGLAAAISSASSGLGTVSSNLQESISSLDAVQSSLQELSASLSAVKVTEAATLTQPLLTKVEKVTKESTYLNYTFSTLLVLVVMFTSLLLGTILVMMEKNSPAFVRNYFLPLKKTTFIISIYLTNLLLILVQIFIILAISLFFLNEIAASLPQIALILFIAASVFTFLGMAIGYAFHSEETGVLASISAGSLLLFVSGVVLPLETISPTLREITVLNPFVLSEKLIREIFIFGSSLGEVWVDVLVLIGYAVALFLIVLIIESVLHQHLIQKFIKLRHQPHREADKKQKVDF